MAAGVLPGWRRMVIALLCAVIVGWLVEFAIDQTAFEHRIAVWMIQMFQGQVGVWMIASTIRILPSGLVCVAMYLYLSPDRYPDSK